MAASEPWRLQGYDTFSGEYYPVRGEYPDEASAVRAGLSLLDDLERQQPSAETGGQSGLQDRVYVVGPAGRRYRLTPKQSGGE